MKRLLCFILAALLLLTATACTTPTPNGTATTTTAGSGSATTGSTPTTTVAGNTVTTTAGGNDQPADPTTGDTPVSTTGNAPVSTTGNAPVSTTNNIPVNTTGNTPVNTTGNIPVSTTNNIPVNTTAYVPTTTVYVPVNTTAYVPTTMAYVPTTTVYVPTTTTVRRPFFTLPTLPTITTVRPVATTVTTTTTVRTTTTTTRVTTTTTTTRVTTTTTTNAARWSLSISAINQGDVNTITATVVNLKPNTSYLLRRQNPAGSWDSDIYNATKPYNWEWETVTTVRTDANGGATVTINGVGTLIPGDYHFQLYQGDTWYGAIPNGILPFTVNAPVDLSVGVYVDTTNGNDSNAGTKTAPLKSLAAAINKVNALGLRGEERLITYLKSDFGNVPDSFWLKNKCNAYTETITIRALTATTTVWSNGNMYMVGPLTLNCWYGNCGSKTGLEVTSNGHSLRYGTMAKDVYGTTKIVDSSAVPTRVVSCWGDSITESMQMADADRYPKVLNNLLGSGYLVQNSGDGGENTLAIMARQGAIPVFTESTITFGAGVTRVKIGNGATQGLVTNGNQKILFTPALGRDISVNDMTIGGNQYAIVIENFNWTTRACDVYLTRKNGTSAVTIPAGTSVTLASASVATNNYCDVYLMGANGGWNNDVNTLISHFQKMIDHRGNDNYLIVIPYWRTDCVAPFKAAFGDKAINLVEYVKTKGLASVGITPSAADVQTMNEGLLPTCLVHTNVSVKQDVHMNSSGYRILATAVFEAGKAAGYWS